MTGFLLRRLLYLSCLVVISTSMAYLLAATQLNPRTRYEGRNPPPPPAVVDATLDALNMNDKVPVLTRFGRWAERLVRGDLGRTIDNQPVNDEIGRRMWVSLRLVLIGCDRRHAARRCRRRVRRGQAVPARPTGSSPCSRSSSSPFPPSSWPSCSRTPASA